MVERGVIEMYLHWGGNFATKRFCVRAHGLPEYHQRAVERRVGARGLQGWSIACQNEK